MILTSLEISRDELEARTGWKVEPQGLCRGSVCIPFDEPDGETIDLRTVAERLRMPVVTDDAHGLWSVGPPSGGKALVTSDAPDLVLPDLDGTPFSVRSLRGQKVFLLAWASW